ncbi:carboxypeptidase-like regulatory domain-containing protein [Myxococcus virescens]|uniref:carboxypeptidase-like regulatory domain-containing protein n=1 Tax=Myxococcus virescens TaxID=83456 RepID=UPI003DA5FE4E
MRASRHPSFLALAALAVAGACGGFNNGPLEAGTVRGRILEVESDVAVVSVFGKPDLRASVSPDGRFELRDVPATSVELFLIASRTRAARTKVLAEGARIIDVGTIDAPLGGFITVRVRDSQGGIPPRAKVEVDETVFDDLEVDASSGEVRIGPLPAGCYTLEVEGDEHDETDEDVCVREGEELVREVVLGNDDHGRDDDGDSADNGGDE